MLSEPKLQFLVESVYSGVVNSLSTASASVTIACNFVLAQLLAASQEFCLPIFTH